MKLRIITRTIYIMNDEAELEAEEFSNYFNSAETVMHKEPDIVKVVNLNEVSEDIRDYFEMFGQD